MWTVQIDDGVAGGSAVQHREVQNHESKQFVSYFKKGLIYKAEFEIAAFRNYDQKYKLWSMIDMLVKNRNFLKISNFDQNRKFCQKSRNRKF